MSKEFNARIKWKKDTQENWESKNPVLLDGEIVIVEMNSGEKLFKIGDGSSQYNSLPFQDIMASQISYNPKSGGTVTENNIQDAIEQIDTLNSQMQNSISTHINNKSNPHGVTVTQIGAVPTSRTINNKSLNSNITLKASDVGADASGTAESKANAVQSSLNTHTNNKSNPHGVTAAQAGAVPTGRTINGKALSSNISLSASDVGALPISGGTLTGNLTGKYLTGTWLQSTAVTNMNSANYRGICVFDNSGWVYLRTKAEILSDIGASTGSGGTTIVVQSNQPSGLKTGDLWYKIV